MKVRVSYTVDVPDEFRRAVNAYWGLPGLASRADIVRWHQMFGNSMDEDLAIQDDGQPLWQQDWQS